MTERAPARRAATVHPDRSEPAARSGRARRGEGDRTRDAILAAAERLLIESESEQAVSIRAVADAVGLTPPSIYRHFADKSTLLFSVCGAAFDRFDEEVVQPVVAAEPDPVAALVRIARDYVRWGIDNPEHYRIMFMGHADHTPEQYEGEKILEVGCFATVVRLAAQAMEQGRIRPVEGGALTAAYVLWSGLHGLVATAVAKPNMPGPPVELVLDALLDAYLRGLFVQT